MRIDPKLWTKARSAVLVCCGGFCTYAGYSIYRENEKFYDKFFMPFVHKLDPELSHHLAVTVSKYKLFPKTKHRDSPILATEWWNLNFTNPLGIAAGFDKDCEAVECLHNIGFGFVEVGSVTPLPQPGNDKPRVFRLKSDSAIINRYGFNSEGHEAVYKRLKELKSRDYKGIIGVNLGKNKNSVDPVQDYITGIQIFGQLADYLVINISSPNTPGLRQWQKKQQLEELLSAVKSARDKLPEPKPPLLVKLAPDLDQEEKRDIANVVLSSECKVDGLIIANTTVGRSNITSAIANEDGGLSGKPLQTLSTDFIQEMYILTKGRIPIIGVGGIFSGQDAYDKVKAGASLVQLYTSFTYHGPPIVSKVKKELDELLKRDGYKCVKDAVGASVQSTNV